MSVRLPWDGPIGLFVTLPALSCSFPPPLTTSLPSRGALILTLSHSPAPITRMYENKYPEVDDLVKVKVRQIAEMGAYVHLLEYNNIEGMILLSELSRRRIRSIQKLIRVGREEVVVVLRVDKEKGRRALAGRWVWLITAATTATDTTATTATATTATPLILLPLRLLPPLHCDYDRTPITHTHSLSPSVLRLPPHPIPPHVTGYIDLSKRRVSPEEAQKCEEKFAKSRVVHSIMRHIAEKRHQSLEELYAAIAWPLYKRFGHAYDALKLAVGCVDSSCWSNLLPFCFSSFPSFPSSIVSTPFPPPPALQGTGNRF